MAEKLTQYAAMVPDLALQGVVEIFAKSSPVLDELYFIDLADKLGYEFNLEASLGGIGTRALNQEYADAAKTSGANKPIKEGTAIVGGEVLTDRQLLATRATRIAQKAKAAGLYFTKLFFNGNLSTDPKSFDGLGRRVVSPHYAGDNGGVMDPDVISEMVARIPGDNSMKRLWMGWQMRLLLGKFLRKNAATIIAPIEWSGQLTPASYDGVRIVDPGDDETRATILDFTETRGTSAVTGSIYAGCLGGNLDGECIQGIASRPNGKLFDMDAQGIRGTQDHTLVEGRMGLAVHNDRCLQRYAGILNSLT